MQLTDGQRDIIIFWAERTPEIQAVMLFGRRCKGTARPDSDVDLALNMTSGRRERRFNNYKNNLDAWEAHLTAALGVAVHVRSRYPALGHEVPAAVKECSIKLWRRDPPEGDHPGGGTRGRGLLLMAVSVRHSVFSFQELRSAG
jgi:predicted nucleotidyltransferase